MSVFKPCIDDVQEPSSQAVAGLRYEGKFELSSIIIGGLRYFGGDYCIA